MKVKLLNLIPDQDNEFIQIHVVKVPAQGTTDNYVSYTCLRSSAKEVRVKYHSHTAILRFVGYFNDKKMRYYFDSHQEKGGIVLSDILNWAKRYKLTEKGIETLGHMDYCYDKTLYEFLNSYGIST